MTRPKKAPWPVARRQNMPSRNVANSGALTKPNTSWSMSMMLLNGARRIGAGHADEDAHHRADVAHRSGNG